ncbi:MAG: hypothetical protein OMM_08831 [Candidatus Magnetoglobus multicellularis str. Araruama]|uniref:Uncharacterized protein n=1 Tax=Candidatus Magnetoglobus multicellularis str. Araruama TaxID=890399 RepID=A0A1V1P6P8_9BACT|nr:MAG: hypothetical protein OMM_08831 [Candidatus Magnetoglobus multicellularis str. Araruama]
MGIEKSKPIVDAFNKIAQEMKRNQDVLNNQQIQMKTQQESFEKHQKVLDDQESLGFQPQVVEHFQDELFST